MLLRLFGNAILLNCIIPVHFSIHYIQIRIAVVDAIGHMTHIMSHEKLDEQLPKLLPGITRLKVIQVARELGFTVEERPVRLAEIFEAKEDCSFNG